MNALSPVIFIMLNLRFVSDDYIKSRGGTGLDVSDEATMVEDTRVVAYLKQGSGLSTLQLLDSRAEK